MLLQREKSKKIEGRATVDRKHSQPNLFQCQTPNRQGSVPEASQDARRENQTMNRSSTK